MRSAHAPRCGLHSTACFAPLHAAGAATGVIHAHASQGCFQNVCPRDPLTGAHLCAAAGAAAGGAHAHAPPHRGAPLLHRPLGVHLLGAQNRGRRVLVVHKRTMWLCPALCLIDRMPWCAAHASPCAAAAAAPLLAPACAIGWLAGWLALHPFVVQCDNRPPGGPYGRAHLHTLPASLSSPLRLPMLAHPAARGRRAAVAGRAFSH